jgi:hypothetical protein
MRRIVLVAACALAIPIAVLGYGYWFGVTHGSLSVDVMDASDREHTHSVSDAAVALLNAEGRVLAEARAVNPYGVVLLSSPAAYACWDIEQRAPFSVEAQNRWAECFARQSRWIPTWIRGVKFVDLRSGPCSLPRIPVVVTAYSDTWWLWWVPLRHIGGKPYTSFNVSIQVDINRCRVLT